MSDTPLTPPPAPTFLSPAARGAIEQPITRAPYPPLDDTTRWEEHIALLDGFVRSGFPDANLPLRSTLHEISGVPVYTITPDGADENGPVYLDVHGGALILGRGDLTRLMAQPTALSTGLVHWAPDYRMPPAHPYPAGLDDIVDVYRALLAEREPNQIVVGGGSAGGNLAAALLLRVKSEGLPMPAGLVLLTPEADLTESGDSFTTLADVSVGLQSLAEVNALYAGNTPLDDPLISPLFGDLTGFPPTLLISGTRDLFLSNTVRMHRRLRESGVDADLHIFDARPHAGYGNAPEEHAVLDEIRQFVARVTALEGNRATGDMLST